MGERKKVFFRADDWMVEWLQKMQRKTRIPPAHYLREAVRLLYEQIEGKKPPEPEDEK